MRLSWRDALATALAIFGGVVVFAKLQSYSWWLIGSWKGALGVIATTGLAIVATYAVDWFGNESLAPFAEMFLWMATATVAIGSLFSTTTKAEFVGTASMIGLSWLVQLGAHAWDTTHHSPTHLAHVH